MKSWLRKRGSSENSNRRHSTGATVFESKTGNKSFHFWNGLRESNSTEELVSAPQRPLSTYSVYGEDTLGDASANSTSKEQRAPSIKASTNKSSGGNFPPRVDLKYLSTGTTQREPSFVASPLPSRPDAKMLHSYVDQITIQPTLEGAQQTGGLVPQNILISSEHYFRLVHEAYEQLQAAHYRASLSFSLAEWLHIHALLLYGRVQHVQNCVATKRDSSGAAAAQLNQIDLGGDTPVFAPIALALAAIGTVEDRESGIVYIPDALFPSQAPAWAMFRGSQSNNSLESSQFGSTQFGSTQFGSSQFNSPNVSSAQFGSRFGHARASSTFGVDPDTELSSEEIRQILDGTLYDWQRSWRRVAESRQQRVQQSEAQRLTRTSSELLAAIQETSRTISRARRQHRQSAGGMGSLSPMDEEPYEIDVKQYERELTRLFEEARDYKDYTIRAPQDRDKRKVTSKEAIRSTLAALTPMNIADPPPKTRAEPQTDTRFITVPVAETSPAIDTHKEMDAPQAEVLSRLTSSKSFASARSRISALSPVIPQQEWPQTFRPSLLQDPIEPAKSSVDLKETPKAPQNVNLGTTSPQLQLELEFNDSLASLVSTERSPDSSPGSNDLDGTPTSIESLASAKTHRYITTNDLGDQFRALRLAIDEQQVGALPRSLDPKVLEREAAERGSTQRSTSKQMAAGCESVQLTASTETIGELEPTEDANPKVHDAERDSLSSGDTAIFAEDDDDDAFEDIDESEEERVPARFGAESPESAMASTESKNPVLSDAAEPELDFGLKQDSFYPPSKVLPLPIARSPEQPAMQRNTEPQASPPPRSALRRSFQSRIRNSRLFMPMTSPDLTTLPPGSRTSSTLAESSYSASGFSPKNVETTVKPLRPHVTIGGPSSKGSGFVNYDSELWRDYTRFVTALTSKRLADFEAVPTKPEGNYAWLVHVQVPRDSGDHRPQLTMPRRTIPKEDQVLSLILQSSRPRRQIERTWHISAVADTNVTRLVTEFVATSVHDHINDRF